LILRGRPTRPDSDPFPGAPQVIAGRFCLIHPSIVSFTVDTGATRRLAAHVEPIRFSGRIRYWNPERSSGLAVVDVPEPHVAALGGLKQQRVRGTIAGAGFVSNVMPAGGGRLALSVSRAMMTAAGVAVGDVAEFEIMDVGRA
jgi:hypothetical protein